MPIEYSKTFNTTCYAALHDAIAADLAITPNLDQIVVNGTSPTVKFVFTQALSSAEESTLDSLLSAWECPGTGGTTLATSASLDDATGIIIPITFNYESTAKNRWLSHEGDNSLLSCYVPAIVPFDCKVVGMTFSNGRNGADTDVEIYVTPKDSSTKTKSITWEIRDAKSAYNTNGENTVLEAGSKLAVFLRDKGTDAKRVVVILYIQLLYVTAEEHIDNSSER